MKNRKSDSNQLPPDMSESMFKAATESGRLADMAQLSFRKDALKREQAKQIGDTSGQKMAARNMFKQAAKTVINRNRELKNLSGFVASADVNTLPNRTFFWSGDTQDSSRKVVKSAMATAQHLAEKSSGSTVKMTPGGKLLDHYAGHPNSFNYLKERFQYTTSLDYKSPQALREKLMMTGAENARKSIRKEMGEDLFDRLSTVDKKYGPLARPGSAAGSLWDVVSVRFARQAMGKVDVVHAAPRADPYFQSNIFKNSTWLTKEKPTLDSQRKTTIVERFAEELHGQLQAPKYTGLPDWTGTGGFRGNLSPAITRLSKIRSKL